MKNRAKKTKIGLPCVHRLEGELGEDWRILGDVSSLPRITKRAPKQRTEKTLEANQNENEGRFGTEGSVQLPVVESNCEEESAGTQWGKEEAGTQWRKACLPPSSSIAFLEKLLKDRRNAGKARTVTFGE